MFSDYKDAVTQRKSGPKPALPNHTSLLRLEVEDHTSFANGGAVHVGDTCAEGNAATEVVVDANTDVFAATSERNCGEGCGGCSTDCGGCGHTDRVAEDGVVSKQTEGGVAHFALEVELGHVFRGIIRFLMRQSDHVIAEGVVHAEEQTVVCAVVGVRCADVEVACSVGDHDNTVGAGRGQADVVAAVADGVRINEHEAGVAQCASVEPGLCFGSRNVAERQGEAAVGSVERCVTDSCACASDRVTRRGAGVVPLDAGLSGEADAVVRLCGAGDDQAETLVNAKFLCAAVVVVNTKTAIAAQGDVGGCNASGGDESSRSEETTAGLQSVYTTITFDDCDTLEVIAQVSYRL